jgi:hypothetical protein
VLKEAVVQLSGDVKWTPSIGQLGRES